MVKYCCEQCGKDFYRKSQYDSHIKRKTSCKNNVDKAVEEKINVLNKK
jgi:hypothetical protein